jgi:hypothetical protein
MVGNIVFISPNPNLEDHPLPALSNCFFNIFTVTVYIEIRSSVPNLNKRHAVGTAVHLSLVRTL